jgi:hypothetical protein
MQVFSCRCTAFTHARAHARPHEELHILDTKTNFFRGKADKNIQVLSSTRFSRWVRLRWLKVRFACISVLLFLIVSCLEHEPLFNSNEEYDWRLTGT